MAAAPYVLNHNIETVPRMHRLARPQGIYERSLELLQRVRQGWSSAYSKSGLMVGLGETDDEVITVLRDLRAHQVDIVTIGQYLSPGPKHLAVDRFVTPEQFDHYRHVGEKELGFLQVVSTPLTRSSYHAGEVQRLMASHPRRRDPLLQGPTHQSGLNHRVLLHPRQGFGIGRRLKDQQPAATGPLLPIHQESAANPPTRRALLLHPEPDGPRAAADAGPAAGPPFQR